MRRPALAFLPLLCAAPVFAQGVSRSFFVPIVLSSAGARGSFFTSELTLTNRGSAAARVTLRYQQAFGGGGGEASDTVPAGQQKIVPDAIGYLRALGVDIPAEGNRGGTLTVRFLGLASPAEAFVTVRTTTSVPEGRAGLAYSGVTPATALNAPLLLDEGPLATGSSRASAFEEVDAFPAPAPAPAASASLGVFQGTDPNGTWSLYAVDDAPNDTGQLAGGWCLEVTTTDGTVRRQCNTASLLLPGAGTGSAAGAPASLYPSSIAIGGLGGRIARLRVTLERLSHTWPDDLDVLLAAPGGQTAVLMSDAGGGEAAADLTLTFDDVTSLATLGGLRQNDADRSNVAFVHAGQDGDADVILRVTVFSGVAGAAPALTRDVTLPAGGFAQLSGILGDAGLTSGYVAVERVKGTAPWYTYAAINDQGNSDGSFVPPLPAGSGAGRKTLVLPVAVEAGSFATEVVVANLTATARSFTLSFVSDNLTAPSADLPLSLAAGQQLLLPDFVEALRARGVAGVPARGVTLAGSVFLSVASGDVSGLFLGGRTASPGGGGKYGVFYTAVPAGLAIQDAAWVYGLQQNAENRTNLAIVNTGEEDATTDTFLIEVYDGATGQRAGVLDGIPLGARRWMQIGAVLSQIAPGVQTAYARVTRTSGSNPFLAYTVVNDGAGPGLRSGDGAFVPAQPDCVYELSSAGRAFGPSGGAVRVGVAAPAGCDWSVASDVPWIAVLNGDGNGAADASYSVAPNPGPTQRSGTLRIAGRSLAVTQLGDAPGPYDGRWTGTTSQQRTIGFTIAKNELTALSLGLSASVGGCSLSTSFDGLRVTPPLVVQNGVFSGSLSVLDGATTYSLDLSGTLLSPSSATGDAAVPLIVNGSSPCTGPASAFTWTAGK